MSGHGKKFTAAEKHFHEKEVKYQKELKAAREQNSILTARLERKTKELEDTKKALTEMTERYDILAKMSGLSPTEIRQLVKDAENRNLFASLLRGVGRVTNGHGYT